MAGWGFEEPFATAIDAIANEINRSADAQNWKDILTNNSFDTVGSLQVLNSADWVSLGIPLRVLIELRKRAIHNPDKLVPKEKKLSVDLKRSAKLTKLRTATIHTTPYPEIIPFLTQPASIKSGRKDSGALKVRKKSAVKEEIKCKVNIIGKDNFSTQFIQQLQQGTPEENTPKFTTQVVVYGKEVSLEFFDATRARADSPTAVILLFSKLNPIMALTEVNEKVQNAYNQLKAIPIPFFLVPYDPEYKASIENRMDWIKDLVEQIKPFRLIDVRTPEKLKEVVNECALYALRNSELKFEINHKITKAIDKRTAEVSFKKCSLNILPNSFFGFAPFVNKLSLESNLFKYFPLEVLALQHLQELNLSGNQIEEIPNDISKLQYLVKLDLDNNNLESLPIKSLQAMRYLEEFKGRLNPLSKVPEEIVKSKNDLLQCIKQYIEKAPVESVPEDQRFKIFAVPLNELMANEVRVNPSTNIPRFVRHSINHTIKYGLDQEGVFRLAGQNVQCAQLREELDKGLVASFQPSEYIHNVTSLLKQWLRELPDPLFLFENYQSLVNSSNLTEEEQIEEIKRILISLPKYNYDLLRTIFRVMYFVCQNSEVNRMDAGNVSKVVGPNLIYSQHPKDPFETMSDINKLNDTLTLITKNFPLFFEENVNLFESENLLSDNKIGILYRITYGHSKSVVGTAITSDSQYLWSGDSKGVLRLATANDLTHVKEIDVSDKKRINCLTQCGKNLWVGFMDRIQVRDEITGDLIKEIENAPTFNFAVVGNNIWVGDAGKIIVYDGTTFEAREISANCLVLSLARVDDHVWGACGDKKIRVWATEKKELVHEFDSTQGKINGLSFINGRIWSCADDSSICIWDVEKREVIEKLENTSKVFGAVKVGSHAWTYTWDGIRVYDCETFKHVGDVLSYHHDAIGSVTSFYDEQLQHHKVFTCSWDKSIICWLAV